MHNQEIILALFDSLFNQFISMANRCIRITIIIIIIIRKAVAKRE